MTNKHGGKKWCRHIKWNEVAYWKMVLNNYFFMNPRNRICAKNWILCPVCGAKRPKE